MGTICQIININVSAIEGIKKKENHSSIIDYIILSTTLSFREIK